MTKITEMSAAYFLPYVFASSGFFVPKKQMTSIKTHMAYNSFGINTLSDKETMGVWCAFSFLYFYLFLFLKGSPGN